MPQADWTDPENRHQLGIGVLAVHPAEERVPGVLRVGENDRDEVADLVAAPRRGGRRLRGRSGRLALQHHAGIDTEVEGHQHQHDGADTAARDERHTRPAPVLDVVAPPAHRPAHHATSTASPTTLAPPTPVCDEGGAASNVS